MVCDRRPEAVRGENHLLRSRDTSSMLCGQPRLGAPGLHRSIPRRGVCGHSRQSRTAFAAPSSRQHRDEPIKGDPERRPRTGARGLGGSGCLHDLYSEFKPRSRGEVIRILDELLFQAEGSGPKRPDPSGETCEGIHRHDTMSGEWWGPLRPVQRARIANSSTVGIRFANPLA